MADVSFSLPWVVCLLGTQRVALDVGAAQEMIPLPELYHPPTRAPAVRGVMHLRGQTLPVLDGRTLFGLRPLKQEHGELIAMLAQRRTDHEKWIDELEACVREGRPFGLTTDPHACGFGRWYDHFQAPQPLLAALMPHFDEPHKAIHALARSVLARRDGGDRQGALQHIQDARRTTLRSLLTLFTRAVWAVEESAVEIAVVLRTATGPIALAVDLVETVGCLEPAGDVDLLGPPQEMERRGVVGLGRDADHPVVMLLDAQRLADGLRGAA
jgi:purine-binding chemotaxis protein CheW